MGLTPATTCQKYRHPTEVKTVGVRVTLLLFHVVSKGYNRAALCCDARDAWARDSSWYICFAALLKRPRSQQKMECILQSDDAHLLSLGCCRKAELEIPLAGKSLKKKSFVSILPQGKACSCINRQTSTGDGGLYSHSNLCFIPDHTDWTRTAASSGES